MYRRRLKCSITTSDEGYQELQLAISDFKDTSIDFYPKKALNFTATAPVYVTEFRKIILMGAFYTLNNWPKIAALKISFLLIYGSNAVKML